MLFSMSSNPIDKIYVDILNTYENWTQKYWLSKPHHVTCRICGKTMRSDKDKFSPEQCGWRHLKQINGIEHWEWGWICHSCDGHFESHWININDISDEEFNRLKINGKICEWVIK